MTVAPRWRAHCTSSWPTPPAAAWTSTISPGRTAWTSCSRKLARHALEQAGRGDLVGDIVGQPDQQLRRHVAPLAIGADRRAGIGDAVADAKADTPGPTASMTPAASMPGTPGGVRRSK